MVETRNAAALSLVESHRAQGWDLIALCCTNCPSHHSITAFNHQLPPLRRWNLMALCCTTFPPSEQLCNYLEVFLRDREQAECLDKLHYTMYHTLRPSAPNSDAISRVRSRGAKFSGLSFRGDIKPR